MNPEPSKKFVEKTQNTSENSIIEIKNQNRGGKGTLQERTRNFLNNAMHYNMTTLAIIGTAFRRDDASKCNIELFNSMYLIAESLIVQWNKVNNPITHLISGGACGADHLAVRLYLNNVVPNLRLYLPCEWENGKFKNVENCFDVSTSNVINHYHDKFKSYTNIDSLSEIESARLKGAELIAVEGGFKGRNKLVSQSEILLAMTFGYENYIKQGGTEDTVKSYLKRISKEGSRDNSYHYNLNDGKIYKGCKIIP